MISLIIPSHGENVGLWSTVASAKSDLEDWGMDHEIIVVCDEQDPREFPKVAQFMHHRDMCTVIFGKIGSPQGSRNVGASRAKGDFLFFADAHCSFPSGYFNTLYGESLRLGADAVFGGTRFTDKITYGCTVGWNDVMWGQDLIEPKNADPFPIVSVGHGAFGITKEAFWACDRYWSGLSGFGGEECQLNFKLWMMGRRLYMIPSIYHWHFTPPGERRGFDIYQHESFVRNFLSVAAAYGGDERAKKSYLAFQMNYWHGQEFYHDMVRDVCASEYVAREREFIAKNARYKSLDELKAMFDREGVIS